MAGEQQACAALFRRHSPRIAGLVFRLLGSDQDLDDLVQETFVEGFRALHRIEDPTKVGAFLSTIAIRRVRRHLSIKYRMRALAAALGLVSASTPAWGKEELSDVSAVLQRASIKHRIPWILHRVEGFTLPEVAEQCEASLASVKRWVAAIDQAIEKKGGAHGPR